MKNQIAKKAMMVAILDEYQYVKKRDGFVMIKEYAGMICKGDSCKEILPETSGKHLILMFYQEELENIAVYLSEETGIEDPFKGDVFLMWMEKGSKTANILVAHSADEGVRSIRCHLRVEKASDMSKCVKTLLQLGDSALKMKIPYQRAESMLEECRTETEDGDQPAKRDDTPEK